MRPEEPVGTPDPDAVALGLVDSEALASAYLRAALRTTQCPIRGIPSGLCDVCSSGVLPHELEHALPADLITMHWVHEMLRRTRAAG